MGFSFYSPLTVTSSSTLLPSTQTNFAVLVSFTDNRLKTVANGGHVQNANGYDIRPYTDSGLSSAMTYQLESYNASAGTVNLWALKSSLALSDVFYLAYSDVTLSTDGSSTSTWDSNYKDVYHVPDGTTLNVNDFKGAKNLTNANVTAAAGKIDGGAHFNGSNAKLTNTSITIPTTGTLSCWFKPNVDSTNIRTIWDTRVASPLTIFGIQPFSDGKTYAGWYNNGNDDRCVWTESGGFASGTSYYVTLTWTNGGTTELRVNGVSKATSASLDATWDTSTATSSLGFDNDAAFSNIDEDEIRLSDIVRSNDWITAEYNNQNDPTTFLTLGTEVSLDVLLGQGIM